MKHTTVATVITAFLLVIPAFADEASKKAKVEEFMRLTKMEEMLHQTTEMMVNQMKSGVLKEVAGIKSDPEAEKRADAFQEKLMRAIFDTLSWESMKPEYVKLFVETYSEQELDDIIAFYKSPTGQSMVAKNPILMSKAMEISQQRMAGAQSEIGKLIREFTKK